MIGKLLQLFSEFLKYGNLIPIMLIASGWKYINVLSGLDEWYIAIPVGFIVDILNYRSLHITIRYIENGGVKRGRHLTNWSFVIVFSGISYVFQFRYYETAKTLVEQIFYASILPMGTVFVAYLAQINQASARASKRRISEIVDELEFSWPNWIKKLTKRDRVGKKLKAKLESKESQIMQIKAELDETKSQLEKTRGQLDDLEKARKKARQLEQSSSKTNGNRNGEGKLDWLFENLANGRVRFDCPYCDKSKIYSDKASAIRGVNGHKRSHPGVDFTEVIVR
jgi:hypothetical protein